MYCRQNTGRTYRRRARRSDPGKSGDSRSSDRESRAADDPGSPRSPPAISDPWSAHAQSLDYTAPNTGFAFSAETGRIAEWDGTSPNPPAVPEADSGYR